ncbi:unnamed protein product [Camellia sinensis]
METFTVDVQRAEVFGEEVGHGGVVDGAYGDGGAAVDLGGEVGDGEVVVEGGEVGVVLDVGGGGELAAGGDVVGHPTLEENGLQFGPGRVDGGCVGGGATADDAEAGLEGLKVVHDGGGAGGRGGRGGLLVVLVVVARQCSVTAGSCMVAQSWSCSSGLSCAVCVCDVWSGRWWNWCEGVDYSLRETRVQFSYGMCGSGVKVCVEVRRAAKTRLPPAGEAE